MHNSRGKKCLLVFFFLLRCKSAQKSEKQACLLLLFPEIQIPKLYMLISNHHSVLEPPLTLCSWLSCRLFSWMLNHVFCLTFTLTSKSKQHLKSTTNESSSSYYFPLLLFSPKLLHADHCSAFISTLTALLVRKATRDKYWVSPSVDELGWWWCVACKTECCVTRLHSQHSSLFRRLTPLLPPAALCSTDISWSCWVKAELPKLIALDDE